MMFTTPRAALLVGLFSLAVQRAAGQDVAATLASQYSLTTSTALPFPTATLATTDAQNFLLENWSLSRGRIQNGANDLAFTADPFPNITIPNTDPNAQSNSSTVLQVTYPAGSFSNDTGGAQFFATWNASADVAAFQSVVLTYDVAFDADFDWVKGGKLPGLRGGPNVTGCSGGHQPNGSDCFSARLMWRKNAAGEVYAYIPTPNKLCKDSSISCDSDYGVSIDRGSYSFLAGTWNRITLVVRLNNPVNVANGYIALYYNNVQAVTQSNLQIRGSDVISIGGLYFSTFFGGNSASWATPNTVHAYFRNFRMYGGAAPSNLTGSRVSAGARSTGGLSSWAVVIASALAAALTLLI